MKVYSAIYNDPAHLQKYGQVIRVVDPLQLDNDGILLLHGGEDICPMIYNELPNSWSGAEVGLSRRDKLEIDLVKAAQNLNIPIVGICRGAQLLTALAGGKLVQHVTGHGKYHKVTTYDGKEITVSSAHHQMCLPKDSNHELLAWSTTSLSSVYIGEADQDIGPIEKEPELIWYPKLRALACQPHPEWMPESSEFVKYLLSQIEEKLLCPF